MRSNRVPGAGVTYCEKGNYSAVYEMALIARHPYKTLVFLQERLQARSAAAVWQLFSRLKALLPNCATSFLTGMLAE